MMFRVTMIAALAGFVSAQTYSIGCLNTLMNIASNSEISQCLAPSLLFPILVGAGNTQDSLIGPIDTWLGAMCGAPPCSTTTISALATNLTAGCSTEFDLGEAQSVVSFVSQNYWTARKMVCLKDGQTNCVTQTLQKLQDLAGTLNLSDGNVNAIAKAINTNLAQVSCSNCAKGALSIVMQDQPSVITADFKQSAQNTCGTSFVDGGIPQGLIESAYTPTSASSAAPSPTSTTPATPATARPSASIPVSGNSAIRGSSTSLLGIIISGLVAVMTGLVLV